MALKIISLYVLQGYCSFSFVPDERMGKGGWDDALCSSFTAAWGLP
jgi:hypothetical protein